MEIVKFIFSSFWIWFGAFMLLSIPFESIVRIVTLLIRGSNISKHGWPPTHLDADGDFRKEKE